MRRHVQLPLLVALSSLTLACASARSSGPRVEAPRMISTNGGVQVMAATTRPRAAKVAIEVEVDEHGKADLRTLRLSGPGAADYRAGIEQWIAGATFRPAHREGVAVRGVFKTTFEVRAGATRVIRRE